MEKLKILKSVFGFDSFKADQENVLKTVCDGTDAFVLWATGTGKSLCYQFPPLIWQANRQKGIHDPRKVVIVVSPLVSLMQDQVAAINARNSKKYRFQAVELSAGASQASLEKACRGEFELIFITPERLTGSFDYRLRKMVQQQMVGLFAIDEAHCVSEWGHDFRPSYKQLHCLREGYPDVPILALTATATEQVKVDIIKKLGMQAPLISFTTFNRENLEYHCKDKRELTNDLYALADEINDNKINGVVVIYCMTRKDVDHYTFLLKDKIGDDNALRYHAGMSPQKRETNLRDFMAGRTKVMVATIAFGMGIDKADIRRVIHVGSTKSVESYYQQTGRAGRDGEASKCVMYFNSGDFNSMNRIMQSGWREQKDSLSSEFQAKSHSLIQHMERFAGLSRGCRRKFLLNYFGEEFPHERCESCDNCLNADKFTTEDIGKWTWLILHIIGSLNCYGNGMYVDLVRGSTKQKIREKQLHTRFAAVHGKGKDRPDSWWKSFLLFLKEDGYIESQVKETRNFNFTITVISAKGKQFLTKFRKLEDATLEVLLPEKLKVEPKITYTGYTKARPSRAGASADFLLPIELQLYEELQKLNIELGMKNGHGNGLKNKCFIKGMARVRPDTPVELLSVEGIDVAFVEMYGDQFLALLSKKTPELGLQFNQLPHSMTKKEAFDEDANKMFEEMKTIREEIQQKIGRVVPTNFLGGLALNRVATGEDFLENTFYGQELRDSYGPAVLRLMEPVQRFFKESGQAPPSRSDSLSQPLLDKRDELARLKDLPTMFSKPPAKKAYESAIMWKDNHSFAKIAAEKGVKESTVRGHIINYVCHQPLNTGLVLRFTEENAKGLSMEEEATLYDILRLNDGDWKLTVLFDQIKYQAKPKSGKHMDLTECAIPRFFMGRSV